MAINLDTWKRLPPDVQKVMLNAIPVALEAYKAHKMKTDGEIIKKWSAKGIKVLALSNEEKKRWRAKLLPAYWDNYVTKAQSRNPAARDFFKRYLELVVELTPTSTYVSPFEK
jgi:TRAP-type C4-dicarboxylate transport system substrate-binding protein